MVFFVRRFCYFSFGVLGNFNSVLTKYGLQRKAVIAIYELGFSDRVISQDIFKSLNITSIYMEDIKKELRLKKDTAILFIDRYPSYYAKRMKEFVG